MRRVIDANLNRAREGMKVLEDVARFVLNDATTSGRLKEFRQSLGATAGNSLVETLSARDASGDVAAFLDPASTQTRADLNALVVANAQRVEESLRVLEEFAKLSDAGPGPIASTAKRIRFAMYDVEKDMVSRLIRQEKVKRITGLYVIVDTEVCADRGGEVEVARLAIEGGATTIQLRDKVGDKARTYQVAAELMDLCQKTGTIFIVDDHVDVAIMVGAHGVHVGQQDLPVTEVRKLVPIDMLIGCTTPNVETAQKAVADGADHLGVGTGFPTTTITKKNAPRVTRSTLEEIRQAVTVPLVGIAGINAENAPSVMQAGAIAVAVISSVVLASDIRSAARALARAVEQP